MTIGLSPMVEVVIPMVKRASPWWRSDHGENHHGAAVSTMVEVGPWGKPPWCDGLDHGGGLPIVLVTMVALAPW